MVKENVPNKDYAQRLKRVEDAIALKVPDRVPVIPISGYLPAKYAGISVNDAFYDPVKWRQAYKETIVGLQPDMYTELRGFPGHALDLLGCKQVVWPGQSGVPAVQGMHQFVEGEYMKSDEYDEFLCDLPGYITGESLPRTFSALEKIKRFQAADSMIYGYIGWAKTGLLEGESSSTINALRQAVGAVEKWTSAWSGFSKEMAELGFIECCASTAQSPFDIVSDYHRGMRGTMLDMYRQPDKLIEACEKIVPIIIENAAAAAETNGNPRIIIPLHRGSDSLMSLKQFTKFYWPTLKKVITGLVERGFTPCPFFEGDYNTRLELLLELPRGKVMAHFERTDIFRAKEILKDHLCIRGNVPNSLLHTGTTQEVKDYCKKLIDIVGKDGGFVLSSGGPIQEARLDNIRAMFDFTREYGVYA